MPASEKELDQFKLYKKSFDPNTGLNLFHDERLIKSREAMILAVEIFNSPSLKFKTEIFTVLASIAWTYLLHEFFERRGTKITDNQGRSLLLSQMIKRQDCPLSKGVKNNISLIINLRDKVEHLILGPYDKNWFAYFQACCLNYEKAICDIFRPELSLSNHMSVALQFSKLTLDQAALLNSFDLPEQINALDNSIFGEMSESEKSDLEFRFLVNYKLENSSKSKSHFIFSNSENANQKIPSQVLIKNVPSDDIYPFKPKEAVRLIEKKSGLTFTINNHTNAYKLYKVRPKTRARNPEITNKEYCIYHKAHKDYTYSQAWIDFLSSEILDSQKFERIKKSVS